MAKDVPHVVEWHEGGTDEESLGRREFPSEAAAVLFVRNELEIRANYLGDAVMEQVKKGGSK